MKRYKEHYWFVALVAIIVGISMMWSNSGTNSEPMEDAVEVDGTAKSAEPKVAGGSIETGVAVVSGIVTHIDGAYFIKGCDWNATPALMLLDTTGELERMYRATASPGNDQAFASLLVERELVEPEGLIGRVTAINYWPIEGFNCSYPWKGFGFKAFGNEPFWIFEMTNGQAELSRPDQPNAKWNVDTSAFPLISSEGESEVKLFARSCIDGMSGNHFGYQVSVRIDGTLLKGCGMLGMINTEGL